MLKTPPRNDFKGFCFAPFFCNEFTRHKVQGGSIQSCQVGKAELSVCDLALRCVKDRLLYARVDLVWFEESWRVSELELLDPELFLTHDKLAVERFADAVLKLR